MQRTGADLDNRDPNHLNAHVQVYLFKKEIVYLHQNVLSAGLYVPLISSASCADPGGGGGDRGSGPLPPEKSQKIQGF